MLGCLLDGFNNAVAGLGATVAGSYLKIGKFNTDEFVFVPYQAAVKTLPTG
jgi:hypothetical protein